MYIVKKRYKYRVDCDGLVDHAFGFQTVDLRSNPTRFLLSLFIHFIFVFIYLYVSPINIFHKTWYFIYKFRPC